MGKLREILHTELLIIGQGIAGLSAGLEGSKTKQVILVHKGKKDQNSTSLAQGGIATALNQADEIKHYQDTLFAGAGLCNKHIVKKFVQDGRILGKKLSKFGVVFDQDDHGLKYTREAAHSTARILHAGDSTGAEIERALLKKFKQSPNAKVFGDALCLKLIVKNNVCHGAIFATPLGQIAILAPQTILATGGYVQVYKNNTNRSGITGDGIALAYAAGAKISDMEFTQFHPTTLSGNNESGSAFLISEAVRGEGAVLRNVLRSRFMPDYHPLAELAPRDIVTRAIVEEMHKTLTDHVLLDLSNVKINIPERFPSIYRHCQENGINIAKDLVPVSPAAHYAIGGISTNENGQTSIQNLFACGECAATGIHGANRLASNSLLEGLVFGYRAAQTPVRAKPNKNLNLDEVKYNKNVNLENRQLIKEIMWQNVGIIRNGRDLLLALNKLQEITRKNNDPETNNLLTCAILTTQAALLRKESRGCHFRSDYPRTKFWAKHITLSAGKS